jgi:hypothetical protein
MAQEPERADEEPASSEEALEFVRQLQQEFLHTELSPDNAERLRQRLSEIEPEKLRSLASRIMMDIFKRPARTIDARTATEPPPDAVPPADKDRGSAKR